MTIHVYHPYRQPDGINHCQAVNGHCSHLCLPAPQILERSPKISCACPNGLLLMPDGLTCTEGSKFFLQFLHFQKLFALLVSAFIFCALRAKKKSILKTFSLAFLPRKQKTFISDESRIVTTNNQTSVESPPSMHPEEQDTGTVALIAIAVLTSILVIASIVSIFLRHLVFYCAFFHLLDSFCFFFSSVVIVAVMCDGFIFYYVFC